MDDIELGRLLDWAEGRLADDEAAAVQRAVDAADAGTGDASTRAAVTWIRSFHRQRRAITYPGPPEHLRARLTALFNARQHDADSFLAELMRDDHVDRTAAGVRGAQLDEPAQLVFLSAGFDVVLDVEPLDPRHVTIRGQVLAERGTGAGHDVAVAGLRPVTTDEHGAFVLERVPASVTAIRITSPSATLEVPIDLEHLE